MLNIIYINLFICIYYDLIILLYIMNGRREGMLMLSIPNKYKNISLLSQCTNYFSSLS